MNDRTNVAVLEKSAVPAEVRAGFGTASGFALMQRQAQALAASTLVPPQFQENIANCLIALEIATRLDASPLLVIQNLYIVHGKPGWSSKFLIASFNQSGRFSSMRFEWVGERGKDTWGCRAWAIEKATGERIEGPTITIALAKAEGWFSKSGSKWQTIPELMLMYRAAGWLVNTHAPEISMGLATSEEQGDIIDAGEFGSSVAPVTTSASATERAKALMSAPSKQQVDIQAESTPADDQPTTAKPAEQAAQEPETQIPPKQTAPNARRRGYVVE